MKKGIKWTLRKLSGVFLAYANYTGIQDFFSGEKHYDEVDKCGTIVRKYETDQIVGKYGRNTEHNLYLDIKYPDGFVTKEVSTDVWYRFSEGQTICFYERVDMPIIDDMIHFVAFLITIVTGFAMFVGVITGLIFLIFYAFSDDT